MTDMTERHEVRVRGRGREIVFIADSGDGRLLIRQETVDGRGKNVCSIALADPEELEAFFMGLRKILQSLGHKPRIGTPGPGEKEINPGRAKATRS